MLSLGKKKYVIQNKYCIRQLPLGKYLECLEKLSTIYYDLYNICFPDMEFEEALDTLINIEAEDIKDLLERLLTIAPEYILELISILSGISMDDLLSDEEIGILGFVEIIEGIIEVNGLGKLKMKAKKVFQKITTSTGSKN